MASKGKTVFISIGGCSEKEVEAAIDILESNLDKNFVIFNCLSAYPAPLKEMSFGRITRLKEEFKIKTGFSDHSVDERSAIVSYALGARFFEKHIMLENGEPLDYEFSADKISFTKYVEHYMMLLIRLRTQYLNHNPQKLLTLYLKEVYLVQKILKRVKFLQNRTLDLFDLQMVYIHLYMKTF